MRILVTGAKGFIGQNLIARLQELPELQIDEFDKNTSLPLLEQYCGRANFIFHLAGVNRPTRATEYEEGNVELTALLIEYLKKQSNHCPVMYASSIQAKEENPYGLSKRAAEELLQQYSKETGGRIYIYRFPNVFGKWCRPDYNSVIATFCYKAARELPITVHDPSVLLSLLYIDDLVEDLIRTLEDDVQGSGAYCDNRRIYKVPLKRVAELIEDFSNCHKQLTVPDMSDSFTKKLYSTYLSYLPKEKMLYGLDQKSDQRGSFTELIKQTGLGQVSVNISKPGITKGNHYHNTKIEKFIVVSGRGLIRLRKVFTEEVFEYNVNGEKPEVVEIPPGYTHQLVNLGDTDLVTIIWANESFDPTNPDTYYLEV